MAYRNDYPEACTGCGKSTNEACDHCNKPFDSGCLFNTGVILTLDSDPRNEDYAEHPTWQRAQELCLTCYVEMKGHAPIVLWEESPAETRLFIDSLIESGYKTSAGDGHSWYSAPVAGELLTLNWGNQR